jgi:hypothetical protein
VELTPVTALGLVVALGGFTALDRLRAAASASIDRIRTRSRRQGRPHPASDLREHVWKWAIPAVLVVVVAAEGNSLASIGWHFDSPPRFLAQVAIGLGITLGVNLVSAPLWRRVGDGGESLAAGLGAFTSLSTPERLFVAFTAGATEETAFHGYGIERLVALTGSLPFAGGVAFVAFTLGHAGETWDREAVLRIAQPALVMTLLYLTFRSLPVLIAIHALNDAVGLLLADRFASEADGDVGDTGDEEDGTDAGDEREPSAAIQWLREE